MAKPEHEDTVFIYIGRFHAIQAFVELSHVKPETKFDGKSNVLLSLQQPHVDIKDGVVLELAEVEDGIGGAECPPTLSISIRYPDHRVLSVVGVSRMLTSTGNARQLKLYAESFRSCMQDLLLQDERLSKTTVTVCPGDEDALEAVISEDDLERCCDTSSPMQNIGEGLASLYFSDQLYPVICGMKERVGRWSQRNLLPAVVIDCSNDHATVGDERFKAIGWISVVTDPKGRRQRLISSQVFQLERDTEGDSSLSAVIIERPQPIWTLKMLQKIGKLSQEEYEREFLSFTRMLNEIIAAKVDSGQIKKYQCFICDGNEANLADRVWNCADEYNKQRMRTNKDDTEDFTDEDLEIDGEPNMSWTGCPNISSRDGRNFTDVDSVDGCLNSGCRDNALLRLVAEMNDKIVTEDVFCLTEDAGGEYDLKISPSLEVSVSMVPETCDDDDVILNVDMMASALKQENLISDEVKSQLTSATYSNHRQAGLVLQLLLFILNLNIAIYPSLAKAFEGLKQRAKQSKDGPQEGGNFNSPKTEIAKPTGERGMSKHSKAAETKSQKTSLRGPEAKLQIMSNVLFMMVEGKNYYPYDFEVQLRKFVFENKQDVCKMRNKDGLTLLQAIVTSNRPQFFGPLFRAGCWTDLKPLTAESGPYEGKTAEDICVNARFRKVQKEMDVHQTWEKSLNQIHLAARKGDLAEVKRMLKFSQDLHNETDSMECTSLYWAVVGGNVDVVKLLMNLKVDHTKVNKRKESLLHIACIVGHAHLLMTLVKSYGMDWTVKDAAKKSPLLRVAENGDDKSLVKLMKCGLRKEKLGPILAIAGHYGRIGFLRKVIEDQGIDPGSKDDAGKSPFMRACEQGKLEVAKYLLTRGIDICETDTRRRNVLHMAADGAGVEMVEFLINEIRARKGDDVLRRMLCHRDKYIGGELCMLIRGKDKGRDSWHYVEVSRGLMDVFMKRTRSGTIDVAKYGTLLHSGWGVDPDEESAREIEQRFETRRNASMAEDLDVTPLHIAAFKDKEDVGEILMEKGSDVNARDKFGLTPLHVAAMRGNLTMVKGLLKRGAATDVLDNLIKTPMDVAEDNEHREVAGFIRSSQYLPVAQNFRDQILPNIQRLIGEEFIRGLQESGRDVRTHLINTLRDLTIDINESLLSLGSGPVLEESTSNDHSSKR